MKKNLPFLCPSCTTALKVQSLACPACDTVVSGIFTLPILSQLSEEEQAFILDFVTSSGSLKLMAEKLKLSYPSVRNRLDDIIHQLTLLQKN
ncbi:MAG: DUF2089 family protein [Phycisphaerales bacterium]|nr:DUF2089 family protein [Phycisphaerales bacterium]